jgi:hypothetical protein
MSTALSMFQNQKYTRIRWRRKVKDTRIIPSFAETDMSSVRTLSELVAQVKDEQGYIVVRERTHRNTAESTNARVKWWSMFQILLLVAEGMFQVWWIKRFFEVC